ncbi:MAG TPA: hypothetical protein VK875_08985 [Euzebyales bacterium]|nr:hypothetical protein [Euzebyales bacterium]
MDALVGHAATRSAIIGIPGHVPLVGCPPGVWVLWPEMSGMCWLALRQREYGALTAQARHGRVAGQAGGFDSSAERPVRALQSIRAIGYTDIPTSPQATATSGIDSVTHHTPRRPQGSTGPLH